ncbi:UPF0755 protein [Cyclonatronum proteinivorum]|uniref:Endolytic murein transglycosylase n=1 Tax=Cyclonatronum proteinivorum TaxID=1457365 RepID=A0A345UMN4_9BACT|nr:endolytic transglycosylase MltG [Cyclonatronum proteinivorum]AXJ01736.1 UPF0755 protein [Cyclonatronum proteinivorum]
MQLRIFVPLLFFLAALSFLLSWFERQNRFNKSDAFVTEAEQQAVILLYEQQDLTELTESLRLAGVRFDENELSWVADRRRYRTFRPGRYVLDGASGYDALLGRINRGEEDPVRVVIHAGQTYEMFYRRVSNQLRFDADALRSVMQDTLFIQEELQLQPHQLFGRMLPNTYEIFWTTGPEAFVRRMISEFDRATAPLADLIEAHRLDLEQILTLASIVELEAMHAVEKPTIAGLYTNRLNRRMRLQADPTVNYALGRRGRLRVADYRFQHPYNTYVINGLPPGPITNPAMSAIRAALQPEDHAYLFMVATPEGFHRFTRTYAEHQRAVAEWRRWLREQDRQARERERQQTAQ